MPKKIATDKAATATPLSRCGSNIVDSGSAFLRSEHIAILQRIEITFL
jgi:hypothetical protein